MYVNRASVWTPEITVANRLGKFTYSGVIVRVFAANQQRMQCLNTSRMCSSIQPASFQSLSTSKTDKFRPSSVLLQCACEQCCAIGGSLPYCLNLILYIHCRLKTFLSTSKNVRSVWSKLSSIRTKVKSMLESHPISTIIYP